MQIMQKLSKYNTAFFQGKINDKSDYFLFQKSGQPIFIKACFLAGSRFEAKSGLAHFLEHMLLAGTEKYPNKRLLTTPTENMGVDIGAYTNMNYITVYLELADHKDLNASLEIMDQVINHPTFEDKFIETERGAIIAETQMRYHNRAIRVADLANTLTYQKTSCGVTGIGEEDVIKTITKSDLVNYYNSVFKKSPIFWSIAGDIEEPEIVKALNQLHNPSYSLKDKISEDLPIIREKTTKLEIFNDNKTDLYFGFRTSSPKEIDFASLDVILNYLSWGRASKLQEELRYKRGLIYGCFGENFLSFDAGDWYIKTACSADKTQEVLDVIVNELKDIKENGLSDEELKTTKNKIIKSNIIKMQTAKSWADWGSKPAFISAPEKFLITNYEEAIEKVTSEEIQQVARKYFTDDNWYLAMCGPKSLEKIRIKF